MNTVWGFLFFIEDEAVCFFSVEGEKMASVLHFPLFPFMAADSGVLLLPFVGASSQCSLLLSCQIVCRGRFSAVHSSSSGWFTLHPCLPSYTSVDNHSLVARSGEFLQTPPSQKVLTWKNESCFFCVLEIPHTFTMIYTLRFDGLFPAPGCNWCLYVYIYIYVL